MRAAITLLALFLAGCNVTEPVGYVEVKRTFPLGPNDIYRLNGVALEELRRSGSVVVKQKIGPVQLVLDRGGVISPLCDFTLGKNRIATVLVNVVEGKLRCGLQL